MGRRTRWRKDAYVRHQYRIGNVRKLHQQLHMPAMLHPDRIDVRDATGFDLLYQYDQLGYYLLHHRPNGHPGPDIQWDDLHTIRTWLDNPELNPTTHMMQWAKPNHQRSV